MQQPQGSSVAEQAREQVSNVAHKATEKAGQATGQARSQVRDRLDQGSTQLGEQLQTTAQAMQSAVQQLRDEGQDTPARLAESAAQRVERLGGYLRDTDADRMLSDVEGFARRSSWTVLLGGLAVGFAASRVLKASSTRRYESAHAGYGQSMSGGGAYGGSTFGGGPSGYASTFDGPAFPDTVGGLSQPASTAGGGDAQVGSEFGDAAQSGLGTEFGDIVPPESVNTGSQAQDPSWPTSTDPGRGAV